MSDQFGDGLYRVSESRPWPVDGCAAEFRQARDFVRDELLDEPEVPADD